MLRKEKKFVRRYSERLGISYHQVKMVYSNVKERFRENGIERADLTDCTIALMRRSPDTVKRNALATSKARA